MSSTVIPGMRYRDAPTAIEWLGAVFGFQPQLVVADGDVIHHAQLKLGDGMVMLSSITDSPASGLLAQPDEIGGRETQASYIVVNDADSAYERAKVNGGRIILDIQDHDYGGRGFSCADPEGHIWHVGTYDPWKS